jgi:hypothetical protein
MKKEQFLESLLSKGEKLDNFNGYLDNMNFAFSYAYIKVDPVKEENTGEYLFFKNSDLVTYKRVHAYVLNNEEGTFLYLFKNSAPGRIKYVSNGDDTDLFSHRLIEDLVYSINKCEKNNIGYKGKHLNFFKLYLKGKGSKYDIYDDREYILNNIRKNPEGDTVCWHIYPKSNEDTITLNILEHVSPINKFLVNSELRNEMEENVHFVPIEKNNKDWKKYIPS